MRISDQDVSYVADLANLELTDQERQRMVKDLNSILEYIDRLNELDTHDVPPMAHALRTDAVNTAGKKTVAGLRDDALVPCLPHEAALKNAPDTDGEFFRVPKVIEK